MCVIYDKCLWSTLETKESSHSCFDVLEHVREPVADHDKVRLFISIIPNGRHPSHLPVAHLHRRFRDLRCSGVAAAILTPVDGYGCSPAALTPLVVAKSGRFVSGTNRSKTISSLRAIDSNPRMLLWLIAPIATELDGLCPRSAWQALPPRCLFVCVESA
ncbi:hypothetical protein Ddye_007932 [Dipteronia dyeriana]|uniref:Uncharacterized protein n=1 Tax=Dipteronia dyeriana TaxID=168575 RepID=A0AAD9XKW7_9ROSI|nr:hypothetical protein Ddye_007932 [Dipteronia dyeriana]